MSCSPEQITGYVDGELNAELRAEVEQHLASCAECREQAEFESRLHAELRSLPAPEPRRGLESELRKRLKRARPSRYRVLIPLAAALAVLALWLGGAPRFVAWELARDHDHCFGKKQLPAQVWGGDVGVVTAWFERQGTQLPSVPESAAGLDLVGARNCSLFDRKVAHLYYSSGDRHVSLFVVPGGVRFERHYEALARGNVVRLLRVAGTTVGVVGDNEDDVAAFARAFTTLSAERLARPRDPIV